MQCWCGVGLVSARGGSVSVSVQFNTSAGKFEFRVGSIQFDSVRLSPVWFGLCFRLASVSSVRIRLSFQFRFISVQSDPVSVQL